MRPATTPALALGLAQVVMAEKLYDEKFVRRHTDLPLLVRMDTGRMLRASEVLEGYELAELMTAEELEASWVSSYYSRFSKGRAARPLIVIGSKAP